MCFRRNAQEMEVKINPFFQVPSLIYQPQRFSGNIFEGLVSFLS